MPVKTAPARVADSFLICRTGTETDRLSGNSQPVPSGTERCAAVARTPKLTRFLTERLWRPSRRPLPMFIAALFLQAGSLMHSAQACSLALVVAVDVSASVDENEYDLQLKGLATALRAPEVIDAIESIGGIWFTGFEWSGHYQQKPLLEWRFLADQGTIETAASDLAGQMRARRDYLTALGHALAHASTLLRQAPAACQRQVIDVSTDGINNTGFEPEIAYFDFDFSAVTVNALVVRNEDRTVRYYERKVIRGPGAFVEVTGSYEDYENAMRRKLLKEIGAKQVAQTTIQAD